MDYSRYFAVLSTYKKPNPSDEEKSLLFKVMNEKDLSHLGSYLKFRNKKDLDDIDQIASNLVKKNLLEERKGRLLRGIKRYGLTTFGLFYILSETTSYNPSLLKKYKEDLIMQTLLYQYFEIDTINHITGRLYSVITQYLRISCKMTFSWLDDINSTTTNKKELINDLFEELKWNAKVLAFRIVTMYSETNIINSNPKSKEGDASVTYYELESNMKNLLAKDSNFMNLLNNVRGEFDEGCSGLKSLNEMK